jgi:RNA polymerase sigma factor (sigma-70 family)
MVLRVARSVLHDTHDAEDAFQATFLILAQRARGVRRRESIASWLFGVSLRVASRARVRAATRRLHEQNAARGKVMEILPDEPVWHWAELHEEIGRLPQREQVVVVLCDLEGCTHDEAAQRLGCPLGTVKTRLSRARERLRVRLRRRGFGIDATVPAIPMVGRPDVPVKLVHSTVSAALKVAAGEAIRAGTASAVATLAKETLTMMTLSKVKFLGAIVLVLGMVGGAAAVVTTRVFAQRTPERPRPAVTAETSKDQQRFVGTWSATATTHAVFDGMPKAEIVKRTWVIVAESIQMGDEDGFSSQEFRYSLDPNQSPKALDLTTARGMKFRGIYEFDGERLKICFGRERPQEFRESQTSSFVVLERVDRRPIPLSSRYATAPGCHWVLRPSPIGSGFTNAMRVSGDIIITEEPDEKGGLLITLAYVGKADSTDYRAVVFDDPGNRYLLESRGNGTGKVPADPSLGLFLKQYRLDFKILRGSQQKAILGIEQVPTEVQQREAQVLADKARERIKVAGIEVLPRPVIGQPYEFTLKAADGQTVSSRALKSKVVLVDCWATWCSPCMMKMPDLKALYEKRHADGFEIVGVNFDKNTAKALRIAKELGLSWPQVLLPSDKEMRGVWETASGITSLPRLLLIDRQGILRYDSGPDEVEKHLAELLYSRLAQ